jgi:membrane protease YdiL (CAAX protease family)
MTFPLLAAVLADLRRERVALSVLCYAAVALTIHEYALQPGRFAQLFPDVRVPLAAFLWWAGGVALFWMAIPWGIARALGRHAAGIGLGWGMLGRDWRPFVMLAALAVPVVVLAARDPAFAAGYPLLAPVAGGYTWPLLGGYWLLYSVQFLAVEFFFRGFLPFTLEPRMGLAAVPVSAVPYCMLHFHKPWPEAVGAIAGGVVLAWLALRTRSIWGGVAVHIAVALAMDAAALSIGGRWP